MKLKIILSGGGTGGHIYPAVSVAEALKRRLGDGVEILFVGAEGKMEMEKVPALGYRIVGLPVAGLQRRLTAKNLALPFKIVRSLNRARAVLREFGPQAVVGFGGYASAPVLWSAQRMGIPTIIQEQNSYAGVTNKLLARGAARICMAYDGMERFFPAQRIVKTGNPLRGSFGDLASKRAEALEYFGLKDGVPVILVVGGSLGTRTLNNAVMQALDGLTADGNVQVIWQTGKYYREALDRELSERPLPGVWRGAFIERMDYAFAAADAVISRAGASTVSELSLVGKPVIFVPSPNVAEDHQTKNAQALCAVGAAELIPDAEAVEKAIPAAIALCGDRERCRSMSRNIAALGIPDSADRIVDEILRLVEGK